MRASQALRWSRWQDQAYQELVETARRTQEQAIRLEMYRQADRILIERVSVVPFSYWRTHMLISPDVKVFPTSAIKWWYWKDVILEAGDPSGGEPVGMEGARK